MPTMTRIALGIGLVYTALVLLICFYARHQAKAEALDLQSVPAVVQGFAPCGGRAAPSCKVLVLDYAAAELRPQVKLRGRYPQNLKVGDAYTIWTQPGWRYAYPSRQAYIEQSTTFWPILFFPLILLIVPLMLGVQEARREAEAEAAAQPQFQAQKS